MGNSIIDKLAMKKALLLFSLFVAFFVSSASTDIPTLHLPSPTGAVQGYLMVLDDVGENASFDSVEKRSSASYRPFTEIARNLERNKSYWIKLRIKNTADETLVYYFETGLTQQIDLYEPNAQKKYVLKRYGYSIPDGQKEYSELAAEVIGIKMGPQEVKTVFFRIKSDLNLKPFPLFKIKERYDYLNDFQIFNFLQGLFHGLLWMMITYIFFMYINIRDRAYLYYILYAASFSIAIATLIGYPRYFLFRDTLFNVLNSELILQISSLFVLLLFRKALNIKDISPQWTLFYKIALWISAIGIIVTGIFLFFDFYWYNLISQISMFCFLLFYFTILIGLFKFKTAVTVYYFIGNLALSLGAITITIALLFFGKPFLEFFPIFQLAAAVEAVCFAMGLSRRFQEIEREKREAQSEYIRELKEKQALQHQINTDLEEIVNDRTTEIRRSQFQLEMQRSDLAIKNILLKESNKTLTENLEYAGFMQKALLDDFGPMKHIFADAFLLYKPLSFVSGDFYMFFELHEGKYIIIAADCTGHGVPGAMLTFIAQGFIQDLVRRKKVFCPSELLHHLEDRVCNRLLASSGKSLREGLDASVVYIDTFLREIDFSGARMPLFMSKNGTIERIKGSRHGIGGGASTQIRSRLFEKHSFAYQSGDTLFMATDGYSDQLDESNKKFLVSRFTDLLTYVAARQCEEQKLVLETKHEDWKGDANQTDDILVIGIKLK